MTLTVSRKASGVRGKDTKGFHPLRSRDFRTYEEDVLKER
jgi:hypothetical protein